MGIRFENPAEPYLTVVALWGLGANGYTIEDSTVSKAVSYLESINETSPKMVALKLIAYHYIGYANVSALIETAYAMLSGELKPTERAMLTYALTLYTENMTSELPRSLVILESLGSHNETFVLTEPIWPLPELDSVTPTSFAVMAFASLSDVISSEEYPTVSQMCDEILSLQNPDGGWGYTPGEDSRAKPTYYALEFLSLCTPKPQVAIDKATAWAENHLKSAMEEVETEGMLTQDFYYTALILARYSDMPPEERQSVIDFINEYRYSEFAWRGFFSIPQPLQTAMGINLLKAFNITGVNAPASWLLSLTDGGWGLLINYPFTPFTIMSTPDVPTTLLVLEALSDTVDEAKLKPHLDWLLAQRLEDGFWGHYKKSVNILGQVSTASPSIEYTVRALELLIEHGYDLNYFDMASTLLQGIKNSNRIVEKALAFKFAMESGFLPPVLISSVVSKLGSGTWYIHYSPDYASAAEKLSGIIESFGGVPLLKEGDMGRELTGNHIFVGPFGSFDTSVYNPYVNISVAGNYVEINGQKYSKENLVAIIPGRTQDGYVLVLLAEKEVLPAIDLIVNPTMIKYLHGAYVVFSVKDLNGDGAITPDEVKILFEG